MIYGARFCIIFFHSNILIIRINKIIRVFTVVKMLLQSVDIIYSIGDRQMKQNVNANIRSEIFSFRNAFFF